MSDSVNLNPFVQSSIVDYKLFIEGKSTGEARSYGTVNNYDTEDEECGLIEPGESSVNQSYKDELEKCSENLIKAFCIDAEMTITQKAAGISTPDWDNDNQIENLQNELSNAQAEYGRLIEKYKTEFLQGYNGDGEHIEEDFMTFLMSKDDYKNLYAKYDQSAQSANLDEYKRSYDDITSQLETLKNSGQNDSYTQAQISYLQMQQQNLSSTIDSINQSVEYKKAAGVYDANETAETEQTQEQTITFESIVEESLTAAEQNKLYAMDYQNTSQYQKIVDLISSYDATSDADSITSSVKTLIEEILAGAKNSENK